MAYLGIMIDRLIEAPTKEEIEEDEYEHDKAEGGLGDEGRSQITGY